MALRMRQRAAEARESEMSDFAPKIKVTPPGPKTRKLIERDKKVITSAYTRGYPFAIERGEGAYAWDVDGNKFLDFTSGVAVNALGHAHPEIVKVVEAQAKKFLHMAGTDFYYEIMVEFAEKLTATAPGKSKKHVFLTNSGTESNEAAIKLARYMTRRPKMIAFYNCFHGRSMGSLSLTASKPQQRRHFSPLLDVAHAPYGDLAFLDKWLFGKVAPPEDVAAIFVEPIQGEGGYAVAPDGFLRGLRERCDKHGILLVMDEVQTGLGRSGYWWACEHWDVVPDILTCAKPVGGGLPLGAMIARADLMTWPTGAHANTFGGNPLACAAGLKTIEIIERDGLVAHSKEMGAHLAKRLNGLVEKYPHVGPAHGLGLLQAVDIRKEGGLDHDRRNRIVDAAFDRGLLILGCGEGSIRFLPPMNVKKGELDAAVAVFEDAVRNT